MNWKLKLFLLLLPFLGYYLFPAYALYVSGEFYTLKSLERAAIKTIEKSKDLPNNEIIFGSAFSSHSAYYKYFMLEHMPQSDLVVLGSSRGTAFREQYFQSGFSFYNASSEKLNVGRYRKMLEPLLKEDKLPQRIFMAIDYVDFGPRYCEEIYAENKAPNNFIKDFYEVDPLRLIQFKADFVWYESRHQELNLAKLFSATFERFPIGYKSYRTDRSGYRKDGSFYNSNASIGSIQRKGLMSYELESLKNGRFMDSNHGPVADPRCFQILEDFLDFLIEKNIKVNAFYTPSPPSIQKLYDQDLQKFGYMKEVPGRLKEIFEKREMIFFDAHRAEEYGATDEESFDWQHVAPKAYVRALRKMSEEYPQLQSTILLKPEQYQNLIDNSVNNYHVLE